jgi:hemoglobin
MRNVLLRSWRAVLLAAVLSGALGAAGCGGDGQDEQATSGSPAADRRAEIRVASSRDKQEDTDGDEKKEGERTATLYERLGGRDGIAALVHDLTQRTIADPRVNFERKDVETNWFGREYKAWRPTQENVGQFEQHMVEFLALAAGGPAKYTGREMRAVHEGMKITNEEFDAMVGDIKASMEKLQIGTAEQRELLAIIETTREQIVERQ